jgi:hypothetical protein
MRKQSAKYQNFKKQVPLPLSSMVLRALRPENRRRVVKLLALLLLEASGREGVGNESE